jgi:hypothetical protein
VPCFWALRLSAGLDGLIALNGAIAKYPNAIRFATGVMPTTNIYTTTAADFSCGVSGRGV